VQKTYTCINCGSDCSEPAYLRLQMTLCGLVGARKRNDRNHSFRLGHLCKGCLLQRVRTALGRNLAAAEVQVLVGAEVGS
jgi:hypothetical protein